MTPTPFESERLAAVRAVRDAARVCRAVRAAMAPDLAATKPDRSPVTVADYASQALISLALADAFPNDPIVGEETSAGLREAASSELVRAVVEHVRSIRPDADLDTICRALDRGGHAGGPTGRHWTLDPVDGTKGFLRNQQYAVALALIEDGEVVLGVLGCPNLGWAGSGTQPGSGTQLGSGTQPGSGTSAVGAVFVAERGHGAWEVSLDDALAAGQPIHVSAATDFAAARYTESYESGHSSQDVAAAIAVDLGLTREPLRMDSQAKYAVVARGEAEVYLRLPHGSYVEQVWDHAAGCLIVTEAGGRVSDIHGNALDFSVGRRLERNRGVVVAPAALHAQVLAAAARVLGF